MHRGGPLLSVKKAFGEACERAELPGVTPHTLKHTYITWLLRSGVSLWDVAGLTSTSAVTIEHQRRHHREGVRSPRQGSPEIGGKCRK
jgi:integrase